MELRGIALSLRGGGAWFEFDFSEINPVRATREPTPQPVSLLPCSPHLGYKITVKQSFSDVPVRYLGLLPAHECESRSDSVDSP